MFEKTLDLFEEMSFNADEAIRTIVFQACSNLLNDRSKKIGKKLLQQMRNNLDNDRIPTSAIEMLMKFGDVKSAEDLFREMTTKDIFTYGVMIDGYNQNNQPFKSLKLFEEMKQQRIIPNEIIFNLLVGACAQLGMRSRCQSIVDQIPSNFRNNRYLQNSLIDMWVSISC
jgi:pentatricopeptide repeat protein